MSDGQSSDAAMPSKKPITEDKQMTTKSKTVKSRKPVKVPDLKTRKDVRGGANVASGAFKEPTAAQLKTSIGINHNETLCDDCG